MIEAALHELRTDLTYGIPTFVVEIHELLGAEIRIVKIVTLDETRDGSIDLLFGKALAREFFAQLLFTVCLPRKIVDRRYQRSLVRRLSGITHSSVSVIASSSGRSVVS